MAEDRLGTYRKKRSAGATPEPLGQEGFERPGLFVVQQHSARSLHWDLRLEIGGALASWAVPKGPSLDPGEKRLAVRTEDHPLEYGDFEGVIPEGNYGAGEMVVWDRGRWISHTDAVEGLEIGKLLFDLEGYKLRGRWTLVKTKRGETEWLLIKKPDDWATGEDATELSAESVLSGLTVDELREGSRRAETLREELSSSEMRERGAREQRLRVGDVSPMLAEVAPEPFSREGWLFELKYDGFRALAGKKGRGPGAEVRILYRSGRDTTASFPELSRALAALPYDGLVLDGEVVVLDEGGRPHFGRLQQRGMLSKARDVERAAVERPVTYFVFDLLGIEGFDLRGLPLVERKRVLQRVLPAAGPLRYADHVETRGAELFEQVRRTGLEGLIAKKADARYQGRRSPDWLKVRSQHVGDFVVVGYTPPKGSPKDEDQPSVGALHVAALQGPKLVYAGRVGSGFSREVLQELAERLAEIRRAEPPVSESAPSGPGHLWVEPKLVAEVRYLQVTGAGHLRQPVFLRLRDDKPPAECVWGPELEHPEEARDLHPDEPSEVPEPEPEPRPTADKVPVTNLTKVFWPQEKVTKGDLIAYYRAVAPWLLPYLADRPVVLVRYPDGIEGKSFFQKNAPELVPEWLRTETVWSEEAGGETRYFVCDDEATLVYLANLGAIPLHVWGSRFASLQRPDWSILDLDAKEAPFADAVQVALQIKTLCDEADLPCYLKTSGATGLHVLIPLGGQCTFEQSRQLAELLARVVADELPEIATIARTPKLREGRVYVDFLQNGYGKLLVAPYAVRPLPGAPVSMPLNWEELEQDLEPGDFHLRNAPERLAVWKGDPLAPVLSERPDLLAALGRLAGRL